jgi:hypothetical protein
VPALQVQSPEFKPQSNQKEKEKKRGGLFLSLAKSLKSLYVIIQVSRMNSRLGGNHSSWWDRETLKGRQSTQK